MALSSLAGELAVLYALSVTAGLLFYRSLSLPPVVAASRWMWARCVDAWESTWVLRGVFTIMAEALVAVAAVMGFTVAAAVCVVLLVAAAAVTIPVTLVILIVGTVALVGL